MSQRTDDSGHSVTLVEKNGRFFFFQPDVGVIASDESIENAYQKFLGARHAFWREVEQAGLTVGSQRAAEAQPVLAATGRSVPAELGLFAAKLGIAVVLIGAVGGVVVTRAAGGVVAAVDRIVGPMTSVSMADVSRKAADVVKDMRSLTDQERETLRQSVGTISREIAPMVDAWRNPPAKP
jgi:hypothetical protein